MEDNSLDKMIETILEGRKPAEIFLRRFFKNCHEITPEESNLQRVKYGLLQKELKKDDIIFFGINAMCPFFAYDKKDKDLYCSYWFFDLLKMEFGINVEDAKLLLKKLNDEYFKLELEYNKTTICVFITTINVFYEY
jgi:hypothetical protein